VPVKTEVLLKTLFVSFKETQHVFASGQISLFLRVSQTPLSSNPATIKKLMFKQLFSFCKSFLENMKNVEEPNGTNSRRKQINGQVEVTIINVVM
jgi:hypothetical protein